MSGLRIAWGLAAAAVLLLPAAAQAAPFEDVATLEARVIAALDAEIGAPGGPVAPIDRRLKLAACPTPATIDPPALGAIALRCPQLGWRIRVPLQRAGGGMASVAGAAQATSAAPPLIRRGDPVELIAQVPGVTVSAAAVAQEDGAAGARIRVRTDAKAPVMIAEVVDMGKVRLLSLN